MICNNNNNNNKKDEGRMAADSLRERGGSDYLSGTSTIAGMDPSGWCNSATVVAADERQDGYTEKAMGLAAATARASAVVGTGSLECGDAAMTPASTAISDGDDGSGRTADEPATAGIADRSGTIYSSSGGGSCVKRAAAAFVQGERSNNTTSSYSFDRRCGDNDGKGISSNNDNNNGVTPSRGNDAFPRVENGNNANRGENGRTTAVTTTSVVSDGSDAHDRVDQNTIYNSDYYDDVRRDDCGSRKRKKILPPISPRNASKPSSSSNSGFKAPILGLSSNKYALGKRVLPMEEEVDG